MKLRFYKIVCMLVSAILVYGSLSACGSSTIKLATLECDKLPTAQQISECKGEKQLGKKYYLDKATESLLRGDAYSSIDDLNKVIEMDPKAAKVYFDKALVLSSVGDANAALEEFDKALELDPKLANAHYFKAKTLVEINRYPEAVEQFKKVVEINPNLAIAHYDLAELLYDIQRRDEAVESYLKAYNVWQSHLDANPAFFVQQQKLAKKFKKVRRYLLGLGIIKIKDYQISMNPPPVTPPQTPQTQ